MGEAPEQLSLWDEVSPQRTDPERSHWDEEDPYERVDAEWLDSMETAAAENEIRDGVPRTDSPAQIPEALAEIGEGPLLGPPDPSVAQLAQFPSWARRSVQRGELAGETMEFPDAIVQDVHDAIMRGPNASKLLHGDVQALKGAILLQYNRWLKAARRADQTGEITPWDATKILDESRRHTALMALAYVPKSDWGTLEAVWNSAPVSEGKEDSLEDFFRRRREAAKTGTPDDQSALQREGIQRAADLIGAYTRSKRLGVKIPRTKIGAVGPDALIKTGAAISSVAASPGMTPTRASRSLAYGADLSISPVEIILNSRYNNLLLGPRGILVDYLSNGAMLVGKLVVDAALPEQGGMNLKARSAITRAEFAAINGLLPLMWERVGSTIREGVADAQAESTGTPRAVTGRLKLRMEEATAKRDAARASGDRLAEREADNSLRDLWVSKNIAAMPFLELAGRLKSVADVAISTLAYGMEQTRQAGVMAWREGKHPVDSPEWHHRIAEILDGVGISEQDYIKMGANSTHEAERTTFRGEMGTIGKHMEVIQKHPLSSFILPFLRTLYHIRGWAIDLSPIGAALTVGDVMRAGVYRGMQQTDVGKRVILNTRNLYGFGGPYQNAWKGADVGPGVADLDRRAEAAPLSRRGRVRFWQRYRQR